MDEDLPRILLNQTVALIKLLDHYTKEKFTKTGNATNTPACFRNELVSFAMAAACEITNPDNDTFSETDSKKAYELLTQQTAI